MPIKPNIQEAISKRSVQARLLSQGWMTFDPAADVDGVDWIAMHLTSGEVRKIQQKGRLHINKKYLNKDLWICAVYPELTFIVPHDELLKTTAGEQAQNTNSWEKGDYHWPKPSKELINELSEYILD